MTVDAYHDRLEWLPDGVELHDYQMDAVVHAQGQAAIRKMPRMCLYYKTGAGKTVTAVACMRAMGQRQVLVIAPPTTHQLWKEWGHQLGVTVDTMSHAKFRKPNVKLSRTEAVIVDEFHLLGGYKAVGFRKLEKLSRYLSAPLIIASATPNWNDVERCYCIQRIVDTRSTEGGYLSFIYQHCATEVNPFGHVPRVREFLHYPDAASFLADMKDVLYIEDDLVYDIEDVPMLLDVPSELVTYGVDRRRERLLGSIIERKHATINHMLVTEENFLPKQVEDLLLKVVQDSPTPVLVFSVHRGVAEAARRSLIDMGVSVALVDGKMTADRKEILIEQFRQGEFEVLVGTMTLATGTDGLDKMCDTLVILDDTEDNAMRRQLIGRIMPRGQATTEPHSNRVVRVVPEPLPVP